MAESRSDTGQAAGGPEENSGRKLTIVEWIGWPDPSPTGWIAVSNGVRPIALFESFHDAESFIKGRPA